MGGSYGWRATQGMGGLRGMWGPIEVAGSVGDGVAFNSWGAYKGCRGLFQLGGSIRDAGAYVVCGGLCSLGGL